MWFFFSRVYERPENLRVVVGDLILESDEDGGSPQILNVESVLLNYNYKSFQAHLNDIAVIKVTPKMKFNSAVQPICLPSLGKLCVSYFRKKLIHVSRGMWHYIVSSIGFRTDGMTSLVSGWGRLNATYSPSGANKLQKLTLRIIPNQECKEMHLKEIARAGKVNVSEVSKTLPSSRLMGNDNTHVCALADTNSTVCFVSFRSESNHHSLIPTHNTTSAFIPLQVCKASNVTLPSIMSILCGSSPVSCFSSHEWDRDEFYY